MCFLYLVRRKLLEKGILTDCFIQFCGPMRFGQGCAQSQFPTMLLLELICVLLTLQRMATDLFSLKLDELSVMNGRYPN